MPRKTGSKNLPKDVNYYRKKLKLAGINPADLIEGTSPVKIETESPPVKTDDSFTIVKPINDDIKESYECGNCHKSLDKPYGNCPYCNVSLVW